MGESGSGKTSLLNLIGLIDLLYAGDYRIDSVDPKSLSMKQKNELRKKTFSMIYQEYVLLEEETVYENVALPLRYRGITPKEEEKRVFEILRRLEIYPKLHTRPGFISGGQRLRVSIARALVSYAPVILADEPTGSLDRKNREMVIRLLQDYVKEEPNRVLILMTHQKELAERWEGRIWTIVQKQIIEG